MKKLFVILMTAAICLGLQSSYVFAAKHVFEITNDSADGTTTWYMTKRLAEILNEKSNGTMEGQAYQSGQIGGDKELTQSCQVGDIAFVLQTTAPQFNFIPALAVFDMPMLFKNIKVARDALDEFLPALQPYYEKAGFILMGYADQGFREMSSNKNIEKLDDFKSVKIRTMENKYHMAFWRAIGSNPTPLPFGEVYLSLQQGTIAAQENPLDVTLAAKFYEQQKYIVRTRHLPHMTTIIMSKEIFDSLNADEQKLVTEACAQTIREGREYTDQGIQKTIETFEKNGTTMVEISEDVRAGLIERSKSVYADIRKSVGDELVDALLAARDRAEKKHQ